MPKIKKKPTNNHPTTPHQDLGPFVPEADFDDTIAQNRALPVLSAASVPRPPAGYRPTDPDVRNRRLRKVAGVLRAEALDALEEASARDLQKDLGKYAPDPHRAKALFERLTATSKLVTAAQILTTYARELDQIALSDAMTLLNAENKQLAYALEHEPALAESYTAVMTLFSAQADAIAEGRARASRVPEPGSAAEDGEAHALA